MKQGVHVLGSMNFDWIQLTSRYGNRACQSVML